MEKKKKRREAIFETAKRLKAITEKREEKGFRVVITGKGGAGKTTVTAILAKLFKLDGYNVLAVDEDPQINLPYALGVDPEEEITPLSKNFDYIEEKTGARPGEGWGMMLSLNPDVSDVVERFGMVTRDGINLLVMGSVVQPATGCLCPENALLDAVVRYISLREGEIILMDTQAGVEHFGRALARGFSQAVIVTEPTFNSFQVAKHSLKLSKGLGIPHVHLVVNKVRGIRDRNRFLNVVGSILNEFSSITWLPYEESIMNYEPSIIPLIDSQSEVVEELKKLRDTLKELGG